MSSLVTSLRRLSLRGLVAVATRSARRFHLLYATWAAENGMEAEVASLVKLVDWTDRFVYEEGLVSVENVVAAKAAHHANEAAFDSGDERAIHSSFATLGAYESALLSFEFCESGGKNYLEHALESAESAVITNGHFDYTSFQNDVKLLSSLGFGEFPSLGRAFDPSEAGPIGPIWTGARPSWCDSGSDVLASCVKS